MQRLLASYVIYCKSLLMLEANRIRNLFWEQINSPQDAVPLLQCTLYPSRLISRIIRFANAMCFFILTALLNYVYARH